MSSIRMICTLAKRGKWYGVGRFAAVYIWGRTHRHCKRCGAVKGFIPYQFCYKCQWENLMRAMAEHETEERES